MVAELGTLYSQNLQLKFVVEDEIIEGFSISDDFFFFFDMNSSFLFRFLLTVEGLRFPTFFFNPYSVE